MVMETYHKIQTLFKRHLEGRYKGKMIRGEWTTPALEYLAGNLWDFTEKVDGTNIRIGWNHEGIATTEFAGRTDNAVLPAHLVDWMNDVFTDKLMAEVFTDGAVVTLFGEGYGDKIQNGGKYFDKARRLAEEPRKFAGFVLFDVKIGNFWLERHNVDDIAAKLGIESVPSIGQGTLQDAIDIVETGFVFNNQGAIVRYGPGYLKSQWGDFEAEGIVARPLTPLFDRKGDRIITKIKGVDFK